MSLEELGNIGEFVSSIAVLVSLVYLSLQIKKSTETDRASTYSAIVSDFGAMNRMLASTPDLSYLYVQAMENFADLQPDEKARVSQLFYMTFRDFENMFYQHRKGYLEDEVWKGWERLMLTYFSREGFQTWWSVRREVFSEPFALFLETQKLDRAVASYADVTNLTTRKVSATED